MSDSRERRKISLDDKIASCRKCVSPDLLNVPGITGSAPGFGSLYSPVAIVGEALCRRCMEEREPFVGGSGRILEAAFGRAGIAKSDLFITNSIHCHPPADRDPYPHETANCSDFLRAELREIVRPQLVIGVGKFARDAVRGLYAADGYELVWPFQGSPLIRQPDMTYLLFPPHPYWIMTRPKPFRDQYVELLAHAIEWGRADAPTLRK